jgi:hypothetical protein
MSIRFAVGLMPLQRELLHSNEFDPVITAAFYTVCDFAATR